MQAENANLQNSKTAKFNEHLPKSPQLLRDKVPQTHTGISSLDREDFRPSLRLPAVAFTVYSASNEHCPNWSSTECVCRAKPDEPSVATHPVLNAIASKYSKTASQVCGCLYV